MKNRHIHRLVSACSLIFVAGSFMLHYDLDKESLFQASSNQYEFENIHPDRVCGRELTMLEDIVPNMRKNITRRIPRTVHIIVYDKCVPESTKELFYQWKHLEEYSIKFYDDQDADSILSKPRSALPHINSSLKCLTSDTSKTFLVKLLLLWDYGGIVVDAGDIIPSKGFVQKDSIEEDDEAVFLMDADNFYIGFIAAVEKHPIVHMFIQKILADLFIHLTNQSFVPNSAEERGSDHLKFLLKYSFPSDSNRTSVTPGIFRKEGLGGKTITLVNMTINDGLFFINATIPVPKYAISLRASSTKEACIRWDQFEDETDMISLEQLTKDTETSRCPNDLIAINDTILPLSRNGKRAVRKIPKIIHMTSKTRCMTKEFAENVNSWRFENYSFLLHDDSAVQRLFDREWPEFPLLHDALKCITSGAGKADLWRYLVLWAYGGVYTDIDNAPGPWFKNGTIIDDNMDSFLEVEAGRFPSQYFMAVSPHHSLSYMAVQVTIQRLFNEQNIVQQYVPYVTGPGALKWAMHYTIGNAYQGEGTHPTFDGQTVTLVGNRTAAMQRRFINRGSVKNRDHYHLMDMTHYVYAGRQQGLPRKPCVEVLYSSQKKIV